MVPAQLIRGLRWWRYCVVWCSVFTLQAAAQECPPNLDFERGTFENWVTYTGSVYAASGTNVMLLNPGPPQPGRHEIFNRITNAGETDPFGGFPVVCPNGSGYSVKLGNNFGGAQAEGLSYEFVIPANRDKYSITYHYAVVFEGPNHNAFQQPRLEMEVINVTDNQRIDCSSFTFIPFGTELPGFFESPIQQAPNTPVFCKNWTAVTVNLNGMAGKRIRLFFRTADCVFVRHFGYAYIDVNSECINEFTGASYCPGDSVVTVTAPFGFQSYRWFTSNFSQQLGNEQVLTLSPPPPSGTTLAVEVTPYSGFGCKDTLFANLLDTLTLRANAGADQLYCGLQPVMLGENPRSGLVYRWSPTAGLSDPNIANPFASPLVTTRYVLRVSSVGGGCFITDTVTVTAALPDTSLRYEGKLAYCVSTGDSAVLIATDTNQVQWYRNGIPIPGATRSRLRVQQSGTYHAVVSNNLGCRLSTRQVNVLIEQPTPGIRYPLRYAFIDVPMQLQARPLGSEIMWKPSQYLNNPVVRNPVFTSPAEGTIEYTIHHLTETGCAAVDTQQVKVLRGVKIFIPNAFTPNGDGLNDVLLPVTEGIAEIQQFRIFDRWGREVYTWQPGSRGWNGTYRSMPAEPGAYVWYFKGMGVDEKLYEQKGTVVLIR
ncbi:MAG: gliding motility-associated C-terminal domain-containing protein [Lacibacter sp.]